MSAASIPIRLLLSVALAGAASGFGAALAAETPGQAGVAAGASPDRPAGTDEVRAIQDALTWTGDYSGAVSGNLGPRTREAIAAYLKRTGSPGVSLDAAAGARLFAQAKALRQAVGFAPVSDKRAGFAFALPMKLLTRQTGTEAGSRYASRDGSLVVDTLGRPAGSSGLPDVLAHMSATSGQRRVTYQLLRADFFVVSGEISDRAFYARYAQGKVDGADVVRGFTATYAKSAAARFQPLALAVAASFDPFPANRPAVADPGKSPADQASEQRAVAPAPRTFIQAVLVGQGLVVARSSRQTCPDPRVGDSAATYRIADEASGLALLAVPDAAGPTVPLGGGTQDGDLLFTFFPGASDPDGKPGPLLAGSAQVRGLDGPASAEFVVSAPFQSGRGGTPLFDASGALVGLTEASTKPVPAIAGTLVEADYRATGAAAIAAVLKRGGVEGPTQARSRALGLGEAATALRPSILVLSCGPRAGTPLYREDLEGAN